MYFDLIVYIHLALVFFYLEYSDEQGNLKLAEKNLIEAENIQKIKNCLSTREESTLMNQLSWLYLEKNEYQKSIDYANLALGLEKKQSRPTSRVESFEFLATSYMELGDKEKSKFYMQQYTSLKDSIHVANKQNANTAMVKMIAEVDDTYKESTKKY